MTDAVMPNDTVAEALKHPLAARLLLRYHMHCVGCEIAPFETIAEACENYGLPFEALLDALNNAAAEKEDEQ